MYIPPSTPPITTEAIQNVRTKEIMSYREREILTISTGFGVSLDLSGVIAKCQQ